MVFFSEIADNNLKELLIGLIKWKKHPLERIHALAYVDDIVEVCLTLDSINHHSNTTHSIHKKYGKRIHRYRRNPQIVWYIIYDLDDHVNVLINKIMSNYVTR